MTVVAAAVAAIWAPRKVKDVVGQILWKKPPVGCKS